MAPAPLFLATSLVPGRDLDLQQHAVKSWRAAGFHVLSVNAANEVSLLAADYPDVTLVTVQATAEKTAGKPVPYIHDLLKALRAAIAGKGFSAVDCTVGIINADIHLKLSPAEMIRVSAETQGSVILGARVDVGTTSGLNSFIPTGRETYSVGYDYFLMSGDVLEDFTDSPFCMGMPFWDYWLPLMALLKGRPLKALLSPIALHVTHETRWDNTIYVYFHALIAAVLELCRATHTRDTSPESRQFDLLYDVLQHAYSDIFARGTKEGEPGGVETLASFYDRFQEVAVHHIKTRASSFTLGSA